MSLQFPSDFEEMPPSIDTKLIANLLKHIAEAAMSNDGDYLHALSMIPRTKVSGESDKAVNYLTFGVKKEKSSTPSHTHESEMYSEKVVATKFYSFSNLQDLTEYIKVNYPKKIDVVMLAKALQVTTSKSADYESTIEKIVSATLGHRLRSQAVRGETGPSDVKKTD